LITGDRTESVPLLEENVWSYPRTNPNEPHQLLYRNHNIEVRGRGVSGTYPPTPQALPQRLQIRIDQHRPMMIRPPRTQFISTPADLLTPQHDIVSLVDRGRDGKGRGGQGAGDEGGVEGAGEEGFGD
jgi:hypothetical protein